MFTAIHQFLHDIWPLVFLVTIPLTLYYGWRIWTILTTPVQPKTAPVRRPGARPVSPKGATSTAGVQQNLLEQRTSASQIGEESRRAKAQEPTIRIGSGDLRPDSAPKHGTADLLSGRAKKDADADDEVGALFAGLDDRLTPKDLPPAKDVHARATRLEELGFHHSIPKEGAGAVSAPTPSSSQPATPTMPANRSDAPTEVAPMEAPQLDDILARLDKVLGEDAASAPAAPAPTSTTPPAPQTTPQTTPQAAPPPPKAPSWARADATDDDLDAPENGAEKGKQLGLFDRNKTDPGSTKRE